MDEKNYNNFTGDTDEDNRVKLNEIIGSVMENTLCRDTITRMRGTRFYALTMRYEIGKKKMRKHQRCLEANGFGYFTVPDPENSDYLLMGVLVSELEKDVLLRTGFEPIDVVEADFNDILEFAVMK